MCLRHFDLCTVCYHDLFLHRSQQHDCNSEPHPAAASHSCVRHHSFPHLVPLYKSPAADRRPDPLILGAFLKPRSPSYGTGWLPFGFGRWPRNQWLVWCLWLWQNAFSWPGWPTVQLAVGQRWKICVGLMPVTDCGVSGRQFSHWNETLNFAVPMGLNALSWCERWMALHDFTHE